MTVSSTRAKHRSARRPVTLSAITQAATDQMTSVGRRTAVVAASSGLIVSMIGAAAPATAAAPTDTKPADKLNTVDLGALTAEARGSLQTSPTVSVPADATFVIEAAAVTVTPAPKAAPQTSADSIREERTSRTTDRGTATTDRGTSTDRSSSTETARPEQSGSSEASSAPASANGSEIISIAARYVGVPYVYGGTTPDGFDCSGFTSYVYAQVGISLPRTSSGQGSVGTKVSRDEAQPGDLIWTPGHVSIYAGDGQQIDAPRPGKSIQFRPIWQSNPTFIRVG